MPDEDLDGEDVDLSAGDNHNNTGSNLVIENQRRSSIIIPSTTYYLPGHL